MWINKTNNIENKYEFAAVPIETPVKIKKYIIWTDSLIAVLNLIIDSAPTRPSERTKLDFIVITIINNDAENIGNRSAVKFLFETE